MFERMRMRKQMQMNQRNGIRVNNMISVPSNPAAPFKSAPLNELMTSVPLPKELTKKPSNNKKFHIANTKEQIIEDIINEKPSITDVKKAFKEYVRISQDSFIDA